MALHAYSVTDATNHDERTAVLYRLGVVAGGIGAATTWLIGFVSQWGIATTVGAPSTLVIYLLLVRVFETTIWNTRIGRWCGVATPDLNGTWQGSVSFRTKSGRQLNNNTGVLTIDQTWRVIGVGFKTDKTLSNTESASIVIEANEATLVYQYSSEKRRPEVDDFEDHKGTAILRISRVNGTYDATSGIEVKYYTNHGETGTLRLQRVEKNI